MTKALFLGAWMTFLVACGSDVKLNTETAVYTPEWRPLGVIAGPSIEAKPGETVTLGGRLVGTVTDETILWSQVDGPEVDVPDSEWTVPAFTFKAPEVEGVASLIFEITAIDGSGNVIYGEDDEPLSDQVEVVVFDPEAVLFFEVEDTSVATLVGGLSLVTESDPQFIMHASGGMHTADIEPGMSVRFELDFPMTRGEVTSQPGNYSLYVRYAIPSDYGGKEGRVTVNGVVMNTTFNATGGWEEYRVGVVAMEQGTNVIQVGGNWNYYRIDQIYLIPSAEAPTEPEPEPEPGAPTVYGPGTYDNFEPNTGDWHAQVSWGTVPGATLSTDWATSGLHSLAAPIDLSAHDSPSNVVLQAYPDEGLDVSGVDTISVNVAAANAGANVRVHMFTKHGENEVWAQNERVNLDDGVTLTLDVSGYDWVSGFGVVFEDFDPTSTDAIFYIDELSADTTVVYDFEPYTGGWEAQIGWAGTSGLTLSTEWSNTGERSLALYKDLVEHGSHGDIVLQTYPDGGIDVAGKSALTVFAYAEGAGASVDAHIFWKTDDDEAWPDAVAVTASGVELTIDVSGVDTLTGMGVRFNGVDPTSDAKFFIDTVRADGDLIYDFEGTGQWEFQVNWSPAEGLHLSTDWQADGNRSLAGTTVLEAGDDDIILQTYPEGGILLDGVSTLRVTAHAIDSGSSTQVMLWAKDGDGVWRDSGAVDLEAGGVELTLNISDWDAMEGFGVRFMGPDNTSSESTYFLDQVEFLE
ncbi:CBM35 domain-containing protein [Marinimicrobium sp. ABcell2]|uniref:CBM35 domain-containing protein n=1 Tax=Marinimicrobium sp. ABcell2 TaxID=3069751 RepID=UPI0027B3E86A|nr:CBM35 domain-containing protein [Marinimicrobium sp. ABcell2]MDQ2076406.1 CBM35 domain-containing protein [Marinimicrobium sp. ABcell2]